MDSRSACIQGVLKVKVKVKDHVIRVLSWILGMSYSVIDSMVLYARLNLRSLSVFYVQICVAPYCRPTTTTTTTTTTTSPL